MTREEIQEEFKGHLSESLQIYYRGRNYGSGLPSLGIPVNADKARDLFDYSAQHGNAAAKSRVFSIYMNGYEAVDPDWQKAKPLIEQILKEAPSMTMVEDVLKLDLATDLAKNFKAIPESDQAEARTTIDTVLADVEKNGSRNSRYRLITLYWDGLNGIPRNRTKALQMKFEMVKAGLYTRFVDIATMFCH